MEAILLGLALGDALGWPVEFIWLPGIRERYGAAGIVDVPDPAVYTDDTQMTVALMRGLIDAGPRASLDEQMAGVGARFGEWRRDPAIEVTSPGTTCKSGLDRYLAGTSWRLSGIEHSKGNGAAMRVLPVGFLYQHDEARLRDLAVAQSVITHRHPAGVAGAVAVAYAVKLALDGVPMEQWVRRILAFVDGMSDELDAALLRIGHVLAWNDEDDALKHLGEGWVAEEAAALALYCCLRRPDSYVEAIRLGVNITGDSDSIGCIAGGIMAARLGEAAIPAEWIGRLRDADALRGLARDFSALRAAL
jgi:ADP-ribosylglycohydrolase